MLDDRDLLSEVGGAKLTNCFVKTCLRAGLTASAADGAIRILGGSVERAKPANSVPVAPPLATIKVRSKTRACRPPKTPPFWSASANATRLTSIAARPPCYNGAIPSNSLSAVP